MSDSVPFRASANISFVTFSSRRPGSKVTATLKLAVVDPVRLKDVTLCSSVEKFANKFTNRVTSLLLISHSTNNRKQITKLSQMA